jgi:hypothetical protein
MVRGRVRAIAVNSSYKLAPWADVLFATDAAWWSAESGAPSFAGMKVSRDAQACTKFPDIYRVRLRKQSGGGWADDMLFDAPGEIGWGGNSGFQAINLAAQFGARRIVLIGLDATVAHGVHWHGKHGGGLRNPTAGTANGWRVRLDKAAPALEKRGIEVVNASPISELTAFRKVDFCRYFGVST